MEHPAVDWFEARHQIHGIDDVGRRRAPSRSLAKRLDRSSRGCARSSTRSTSTPRQRFSRGRTNPMPRSRPARPNCGTASGTAIAACRTTAPRWTRAARSPRSRSGSPRSNDERRGYEAALGRDVPGGKLTKSQVRALVEALRDIVAVLADADVEDKAALYAELGVNLTYHPDGRVRSRHGRVGLRFVSEGGLPHS